MVRYDPVPGFVPVLLGLLSFTPLSLLYGQGSAGGARIIEEGQPPVVIHATVGTANSIFLERKLSLQAKPTELPSLKNPIRGWRRWQAQVCT